MVTRKKFYHGLQFRATCRTTQGLLTSPTLSNVVVDNVVWYWLSVIVEYSAFIHDGMGHAVGSIVGVLYADDGLIGSQDTEWIVGGISILIGLFRRIGLMANVAKSKNMTCQPGTIRSGMSEEAVGWRSTGRGTIYRERLLHRLS